ncbi:MAG: hypothetical protein M3Z25_11580 [Actinomycetota bacterium]|nr:hypothetical protein [Actinomycetota bacterium]
MAPTSGVVVLTRGPVSSADLVTVNPRGEPYSPVARLTTFGSIRRFSTGTRVGVGCGAAVRAATSTGERMSALANPVATADSTTAARTTIASSGE